jgi:hypothetical protein
VTRISKPTPVKIFKNNELAREGVWEASPIDGHHPPMAALGSMLPSTSLWIELSVLVDFVHSTDII